LKAVVYAEVIVADSRARMNLPSEFVLSSALPLLYKKRATTSFYHVVALQQNISYGDRASDLRLQTGPFKPQPRALSVVKVVQTQSNR
jgi:hypothetical protein